MKKTPSKYSKPQNKPAKSTGVKASSAKQKNEREKLQGPPLASNTKAPAGRASRRQSPKPYIAIAQRGSGPDAQNKSEPKSFEGRRGNFGAASGGRSRGGYASSRPPKDYERVYGVNASFSALKSGKRKVQAIYLLDSAEDLAEQVIAAGRGLEAKITRCDRLSISRLANSDNHQGIVVECTAFPLLEEDILKKNCSSFKSVVLADEIMDPQNLGAIVRNAAFFGCRNLVITKRNCSPISPVVAKASAGNLERMNVYSVTNLSQTIEMLKKQGFWIIGADMEGEEIRTFKRPDKFALVMGGEGKGMRRLTREKCDFIVKISGEPGVESLNVSSACGIILHELAKDSPKS